MGIETILDSGELGGSTNTNTQGAAARRCKNLSRDSSFGRVSLLNLLSKSHQIELQVESEHFDTKTCALLDLNHLVKPLHLIDLVDITR